MSQKELKLIITADGQQAGRELAKLQGQNRQVFADGAGHATAYALAADGARNSLQGVLGTLAGFGTARYLVGQIDEFTQFNAQLKLATTSTRALASARATVRSIANEAQASLSGIGTLYARITTTTAELGLGQQNVAEITRSVALALKVSGATAQESASAIQQLSQAFGSGVLRGEEFNAVSEAAPRLMKALADGLGVPMGALRGMAEQGKLTSEVLATTLPKALKELEQEAKSVQTIGGAIQNARNELMLFVGQTADSSGAVNVLTGAVDLLAGNIDLLASAALGFGASKLAGLLISAGQAALSNTVTTRAAAMAALEKANADVVATRAALLSAQSSTALAVATSGLAPAQAKAAAASAAHTAALTAQSAATRTVAGTAGLGASALGLLGGPIGLMTTLLGAGAAAWMMWGNSTAQAIETAEKSVFEKAADLRAELQAQIDLIEKRNAAARANPEIKGEKSQQTLGELLADVNKWKTHVAKTEAEEITRRVKLQKALEEYGKTVAKVSEAEQKLATERANGQAATDLIEVRQRLAGVNKQYLDDLGKFQAALEAGAISEAEYVREVGELAKKTFDASNAGKAHTKTLNEGESAAKAAADQLQDLTSRARERLAMSKQELAAGRQLTEAEKEAIKVSELLSGAKGMLDSTARANVLALFEEVTAAERLVWIQGQGVKAVEALAQAEDQRIKGFTDSAANAAQRLKGMQEEAEAAAYAERYQVSLAQAIEATALARLREQQALEMAKGSGMNDALVLALQAEIDTRAQIVAAIAGSDARDAARKLREEQDAEWKRTWGQVGQSFTDALMQGGKSAKQYLEGLFRTTVLRPLLAPITDGIASIFGGPAAAAAQAAGSSSMFSMAGGLKSIYDTLTGSVSNGIMSGFTKLVGNGVGEKLGLSYYDGNMYQNTGLGQSVGGALGMAGNALAGYGIQKALSGGYKVGNGNVVDLATVIGSAIFGPIGGVVGGVFNRAFGRKAPVSTGSGISGTFSTTGADVQNYNNQFAKGGWFRSNKSWTEKSAVSSELDSFLDVSLVQITGATREYASLLGLNADAVNGITQSINVSLKDLNAEQQQAAIMGALSGFGDRLAQSILSGDGAAYIRAGETAGVALARIASSLTIVNQAFGALNVTLLKGSLVGGDAASKLVDLFGGVEQFTQRTTTYFQAFYSGAERSRTATRQVADGFRGLGLAMPASRDALRDLIESQDLYTDAGRATYAALVQLAPAFDQVSTAAEQVATEAAAKLIASLTSTRGVAPAMTIAADAIAKAQASALEFTGPVSTINRLLGDSSSGTLTFGDRLERVTASLDPAQLAVAALQAQVFELRSAASATVVNVAELTAGLNGVETRTFVTTVTGVFELIGQRIKDTLSSITDERVAVRDAAMSILGPGVMSPTQIRAQIAASMVSMPTASGISVAQSALANADSLLARSQAELAKSQSNAAERKSVLDTVTADLASRRNLESLAGAITSLWYVPTFGSNFAVRGVSAPQGSTGWSAIDFADAASVAIKSFSNRARSDTESYFLPYEAARASANWAVSRHSAEGLASTQAYQLQLYNNSLSDVAAKQGQLAEATKARLAAEEAAKKAQLDYVDSLQRYSINASKAVTQLGRLREETVRYYESQGQLAQLMTGTAGTLRATIAAFQFDQMDPAAQFANLQERYNVAYSLALSTTGEALVGYGQEINNLINPLLQKAQEAGLSGAQYSGLVSTVLARAEATASRLDAFAPQDYQAESLGLLGQIDSTLAALEAGAMTADQLIVNAINAGKDATRDGLRAVVAALTGRPVPAFATGAAFSHGVVSRPTLFNMGLMGEDGDEGILPLANVGGRLGVYANMGGSGNTDSLEAEVRALREQVKELTRMAAATAVHAANTAASTRSIEKNGLGVYTSPGQPIEVKSPEVAA